jgi:hypothetical protein
MEYTRKKTFWLLSLIGLAIIGLFLYGIFLSLTCNDCEFLERTVIFLICLILFAILIWGLLRQTKRVKIREDSVEIEELSGKRVCLERIRGVQYQGGTIYGSSLKVIAEEGSALITNYSYFADSEKMIEELENTVGSKIHLNPWLKR